MDTTEIKNRAIADQQAGIPMTRGREAFATVAERSHYMNMWLESIRTNGIPKPAPTESDIAAAIARGKREILADFGSARSSSGEVMSSAVSTFAELHDYVDANEYGGLCEEGIAWVNSDAAERVQTALDLWLRAGRPMVGETIEVETTFHSGAGEEEVTMTYRVLAEANENHVWRVEAVASCAQRTGSFSWVSSIFAPHIVPNVEATLSEIILPALSTRSPRTVKDVAARSGRDLGEVMSVLRHGVDEFGTVAESARGFVRVSA